jgi:hypothetical protein
MPIPLLNAGGIPIYWRKTRNYHGNGAWVRYVISTTQGLMSDYQIPTGLKRFTLLPLKGYIQLT